VAAIDPLALAFTRSGRSVVVLRAAIQPMHRSAEVVDDGQLGVAITYAQNPVHRSIADDHPVHLSPRTVDTDVKQGCETLAAEKVDSAQVEDHLLRSAGVPCDEASEGLAIGGVYVARDGDTYALGCQVVNFEDGAATSLCFVDGRQL
jgi:uncharacterized Zn-binding protein involved in type VI secretion